MKKLMVLLGSVSVGFAHLHTGETGGMISNFVHIMSEPDHLLIVAGMVAAVVGIRKFVKGKAKG